MAKSVDREGDRVLGESFIGCRGEALVGRFGIYRRVIIFGLLAVCLAAAGTLAAIHRPPFLERAERFFFDIHYSNVQAPDEQSDVVLVLAGEETFDKLGSWPWSRDHHARLLGQLGMAKGIMFDILLPDPGEPPTDGLLASTLSALNNVVLACHVVEQDGEEAVVFPHTPFLNGAARVGITNVPKDVDGYLRAIQLVWEVDGNVLASFPLAGAALLLDREPSIHRLSDGFEIRLGTRRVPLDSNGMMWVQTSSPSVSRYEYWDVLNGNVPPETFRDRIVVVGVAASGAADFHLIPKPIGSVEIPGAEFNAKALSTLLWGDVPVRVSSPLVIAVTLLLIACGGALGALRPQVAYATSLLVCIAYPLVTHVLFIRQFVWLDTALPLLSFLAAFLITHGLRYVFIHRDWEMKSISIRQILNIDAATVGQYDDFSSLLQAIWPDVSGSTGVEIVKCGIEKDHLDEQFRSTNRDNLRVVSPGPGGMRFGMAVPTPDSASERYVLLGWDRELDQEAIQALAAVVLSNAWFFRSLKEAAERKNVLFKTIRSIFKAIDFRDPITGGHSNRVSSLALELMEKMAVDDSQLVEDIYLGSLVHDVGKIGISDSVLFKEGRLTDDEYDHIKTHPEIGYSIMESVGLPPAAIQAMAEHHERYDGSGYPAGLTNEAISFGGRVVAVADVFDALTSDRPYRKGMSSEDACKYIRSQRGKAFDPDVVDALLELKTDNNGSR